MPEALEGERLDRALALLLGRSRSEVAAALRVGAVRVGGVPARAGKQRVAAGEHLEAELAGTSPPGLLGDPAVEVEVVHVDPDVVVVDKAAGLVVHPGAGHAEGTLVQGMLARFPEIASVGDPARPGLVHRLDRGTSGLLAVARTAAAHRALTAQLARRTMERRYLALVTGRVEASAGLVDAPIGRSPRDPTAMAVARLGRAARTRYTVERRFEKPMAATLLECHLETGRTHQIRVHLAAIGHPVMGDARYGRGPAGPSAPRPFLHAHRLGFDQPTSGARVDLRSPLPEDLAALMDALA